MTTETTTITQNYVLHHMAPDGSVASWLMEESGRPALRGRGRNRSTYIAQPDFQHPLARVPEYDKCPAVGRCEACSREYNQS